MPEGRRVLPNLNNNVPVHKEDTVVQQLTVRKGFKRSNDQQVVALTHEVIAGLTGNSAFPNLPVELSAVQAALDQFVAALAAMAAGGPTSTAEKNNQRGALLAF